MEKDLEKCGCNSEENTCGCGGHDHDHECGCGCGDNHDHGCGCGDDEAFVIELEDDNGNTIACPVIDVFEYENNEYLLAQNPEEDSVYLFKTQGEELVVPEEEEFDRVSSYYQDVLVNED